MPRILTRQPAVARPDTIALVALSADTWIDLIAPDDYAVPDPTRVWPARDPDDPDRRIQPGEFVFETPILVFNADPDAAHLFRARILTETGASVELARIEIAARETWTFPASGLRLRKADPASLRGDSFQVRGDGTSSFSLFASGTHGGSEQDQPPAD